MDHEKNMTAQIQPRECRHCRHSGGVLLTNDGIDALYCYAHDKAYPTPCDDFEREPGADDE